MFMFWSYPEMYSLILPLPHWFLAISRFAKLPECFTACNVIRIWVPKDVAWTQHCLLVWCDKCLHALPFEIGLLTGLRAHGHTRNPRAHGHTRNPRAHGHTGTRGIQRNSGNMTESWQHCGSRTASPQKGIYGSRSHSNAWRNDLRSRQTTTLRCTQTTAQESTKLR